MTITVYGPVYSTYARTARLALEEKGAPYDLVEVDILQGANKSTDHLERNPFGQVPSFVHDGFALYETSAVIRYIDRVLPGSALTPADPKAEARMNQVMGIVDSHLYGAAIAKLFMQRIVTPMMGGQADEALIDKALPTIRTCVAELDRIIGEQSFVAGKQISLGDLHLAPVVAYLNMAPEAEQLLADGANVRRWWQGMADRPSMTRTAPKFG